MRLDILEFALDIEIRDAPAFEVVFKARQRVFEVLKAETSIDVLAVGVEVDVGVRPEVLIAVVILLACGYKVVALYASAQCEFLVLCAVVLPLALCRQSRRDGRQGQKEQQCV